MKYMELEGARSGGNLNLLCSKKWDTGNGAKLVKYLFMARGDGE